MVQTPTRYISQTDYEKLCFEKSDHLFERTAQGELVELAPTGFEGAETEGELYLAVKLWARQNGGRVTGATGAYKLPLGSTRAPDVAWVAAGRIEALLPEQRISFPPLCPDFVIELRSQSIQQGKPKPQPLAELRAKLTEYMASGLHLGWLINPQDQQVEIYRAGQAVEVVAMPTTLSGENVLPGFELQV